MAFFNSTPITGIGVTGILQPKIVNRFRVNLIKELGEFDDGFLHQTVSLNFTQQEEENILNIILEDDCFGKAAGAIAHLPRSFKLSVSLLDGGDTEYSLMEFHKVKLKKLYYDLDYAASAACKFRLTFNYSKMVMYHATWQEISGKLY